MPEMWDLLSGILQSAVTHGLRGRVHSKKLERNGSGKCSRAAQPLENNGGQGRNRTADASLFRAALYQLSYLATGADARVRSATR